MTRPTALSAVKRTCATAMRNETARPAAVSRKAARRAPKPKRASAPRRESRRAVDLPSRVIGFVTTP
ncbi:MAG TPA: hypothetical protein VIV83_09090 [Gemmatimonadales bacterium]